jgi:hypothetical protein
MRKIIETQIGGIKCDAPGCGWRCPSRWHDDTVEWNDVHAAVATWLNKPCPDCGANLLTEADARVAISWYKYTELINKYLGWLPQIPVVSVGFLVGLFIGANFGSNGMVIFMILALGAYYKFNPPKEEEPSVSHTIQMNGTGKMKFVRKK